MESNEVMAEWRANWKYICPIVLKKAGWQAGMGYPITTFYFDVRGKKGIEVYEKVDLKDFGLGEGYTIISLKD
jgi:hypothetical protein